MLYTLNIYNFYFFLITRHTKRQKTAFKETKQASEPDMAEMLELSDQEF